MESQNTEIDAGLDSSTKTKHTTASVTLRGDPAVRIDNEATRQGCTVAKILRDYTLAYMDILEDTEAEKTGTASKRFEEIIRDSEARIQMSLERNTQEIIRSQLEISALTAFVDSLVRFIVATTPEQAEDAKRKAQAIAPDRYKTLLNKSATLLADDGSAKVFEEIYSLKAGEDANV